MDSTLKRVFWNVTTDNVFFLLTAVPAFLENACLEDAFSLFS